MDPMPERPQHIREEFPPGPGGRQGSRRSGAQDLSKRPYQGFAHIFLFVRIYIIYNSYIFLASVRIVTRKYWHQKI